MDWRRGLLRIWAASSALWVAIMLLVAMLTGREEHDAEVVQLGDFASVPFASIWSYFALYSGVVAALAAAFLVPLGVLATGYCLKWIGTGFRP